MLNACNNDPDFFPLAILKGTCSQCCDASGCPKPTPCRDCTWRECRQYKDQCTGTQPWVCVNGAAQGGCSETETHWLDAELVGM